MIINTGRLLWAGQCSFSVSLAASRAGGWAARLVRVTNKLRDRQHVAPIFFDAECIMLFVYLLVCVL